MKLRYIIASLAASAALFTACQEQGETHLSNIQVSKSYISIPMEGGSVEITLNANEPWHFHTNGEGALLRVGDKGEVVCDWLEVSPLSGEAGEFKVTFSAPETADGRNCELIIDCGPEDGYQQQQRINVIQGLAGASEATVKEAMEGPDKTYLIKAAVTKITGAHYGNMYINDGTVEGDGLQVYGSLDKKGNKMTGSTPYDCFGEGENSWDIAVGDTVIVEGPKKMYNGAPELVDVTIKEIIKPVFLISVDPLEIELDSPEAGEVEITITSALDEVNIEPQDEWLSIKSIKKSGLNTLVTIGCAANGDVVKREGTILVSGEEFEDIIVTITQGANAPDLMTIEEALQSEYVHVKGIVSAICGRGYILTDATGSVLAYYGSSFDASKYGIGDEIEIISDISAYNFGAQLDASSKPFDLEEKISAGSGSYTYPTPKLIDQDALAEIIASISGKNKEVVGDAIKIEYVQFTATPKKSGSYTNFFLDDYTDADFSAYQLPASYDLTSYLDKKVTVRGYTQSISGGKHLNIVFTELIEGEAEVPTIEYTDLSTINAKAADEEFTFTAIVAAAPRNDAVIVTDGTNCFYLYKPSPMPAVGDIITASGKISIYNGIIESASGATVTVVESGATVPDLTPIDITSEFGSYLSTNHPAALVSANGKYLIDGTYTNLVVGDNTVKGSLSGAIDAQYNGQDVKVVGWFTGGNGGKTLVYINVTQIIPAN